METIDSIMPDAPDKNENQIIPGPKIHVFDFSVTEDEKNPVQDVEQGDTLEPLNFQFKPAVSTSGAVDEISTLLQNAGLLDPNDKNPLTSRQPSPARPGGLRRSISTTNVHKICHRRTTSLRPPLSGSASDDAMIAKIRKFAGVKSGGNSEPAWRLDLEGDYHVVGQPRLFEPGTSSLKFPPQISGSVKICGSGSVQIPIRVRSVVADGTYRWHCHSPGPRSTPSASMTGSRPSQIRLSDVKHINGAEPSISLKALVRQGHASNPNENQIVIQDQDGSKHMMVLYCMNSIFYLTEPVGPNVSVLIPSS